MTEFCYHLESSLGPGRSIAAVCYRCGHVGYEPVPDDGHEYVVKMVNIPEGTTYDADVMRRFHDAIFKAFRIPDDLLAKMDAQPFPTREEFRNLVRRNCVNGAVNNG